jgi:F-type H+-transporting ATPase subunit delta
MTTGSVAVRYARAILQLGEEDSALAQLQREWADLRATIAGAPELLPSLANPLVVRAAREKTLDELLTRLTAGPITRNAVRLLLRKGRILALGDVARVLERMMEERTGRARAVVTTATAMPEDYHRRLQAALEKRSERKLTVEKTTDPEILGGVVARVGDMLYDGSLRTALERLQERLTGEGTT